jgi:hypothetical protein
MTKDLNAEQEAGARKDAGGFNHPLFVATLKESVTYVRQTPAPPIVHEPGVIIEPTAVRVPDRQIYIEAERWTDARSFAMRKLGVSEATVLPIHIVQGGRPLPRWQIQFVGSAGGSDPMRMQARLIQNETADNDAGWLDVRELT